MSLITLSLCAISMSQASQTDFVTGSNKMGMSLLSQSFEQKPGNVMVSPLSIGLCLAMVEAGARGQTQSQMDKVLGIPTSSRDSAVAAIPSLVETLMSAGGEKLRMDIANSVWTNRTIPIEPSFGELVQTRFRARVTSLDFSNPKDALGQINGWVNDQTRGKIPTILDRIDPGMLMVLVNAISFKANWQFPFLERLTSQKSFTYEGGKTGTVPTMLHQASVRYYKDKSVEAVTLPYSAGQYSMIILLPPKENKNLRQFVKDMTAERLMSIYENGTGTTVAYSIPKWKAEFGIEIQEMLKKMGMPDAFDVKKADFSGMSKTPSHIDRVIHKTFIEVDEKGTEAAAVTATTSRAGSAMRPEPPKEFDADRPFMYAIVQQSTGSICFAGVVTNPLVTEGRTGAPGSRGGR